MALDLSTSSSANSRIAPSSRPKLFRPYELAYHSEDDDKLRSDEEARLFDYQRQQQQQQMLAQQQAILMHVSVSNQMNHSSSTGPLGFAPIWLHGRLYSNSRKPHRPLCGRYVRSGPAASQPVLVALRKKVLQRQQMKYWAIIMRMNQHQQQSNNCGIFSAPSINVRREFDRAPPQPR